MATHRLDGTPTYDTMLQEFMAKYNLSDPQVEYLAYICADLEDAEDVSSVCSLAGMGFDEDISALQGADSDGEGC